MPQPPTTSPILPSTKLIQGGLGLDLPIEDFCASYELTDAVASLLKTNGYMKTKTLRYVTIEEFVTMGVKPGEVASLRHAVEEWADPV